MAEFCLDCMREMDEINYRKDAFVYSKELELCEGCGQWKRVVIGERSHLPFVAFLDWLEEAAYRILHRGDDLI